MMRVAAVRLWPLSTGPPARLAFPTSPHPHSHDMTDGEGCVGVCAHARVSMHTCVHVHACKRKTEEKDALKEETMK